jgi:hypothetical protein
VDPLFHPPPRLLYPGTNSTSEVPVLATFTYTPIFGQFWILTNVTLILKKEKKRNKLSNRLILAHEVAPSTAVVNIAALTKVIYYTRYYNACK